MTVRQLSVTHASDDDGVWFFSLPEGAGTCPFLIESSRADRRDVGTTPIDVAAAVVRWLASPPAH